MNRVTLLMVVACGLCVPAGAQVADIEPVQAPDGPPRPRAWLGIQVAPTPAALASHLRLEPGGTMIVNIVVEGPADEAGLQRYDVVVACDGRPVTDNIDTLIGPIRDSRPDRTLELELIRRGEKRSVAVTLAEPPRDPDRLRYKYEQDPDATWRERQNIIGRILRKGPDGTWRFEDLGELEDLPPILRRHWPGWPDAQIELFRHPDKPRHARVQRGNATIEVEVFDNGIVVTRTERRPDGSNQTVQRYEHPDKLRREDPEAFEIFESLGHPEPGEPRPGLRFDLTVPPDVLERFHHEKERFGRELREKLDEARDQIRNLTRELDARRRPRPGRPAPRDESGTDASFKRLPDGGIEVTITRRTPDGVRTLSETYPSEKDLAAKSPKLHEWYRQMRELP